MVDAGLAHILLVDLQGEGTVPLADEQRGAEVCQGPHENHQRRRQDGGHAEGHDHCGEALEAGAAHIGRRLQQGVVHVFQGTGHIQEHQGEQLGGQHQKDAAEAVDAGQLDAKDALDELGDDAGTAQEQHPGIGPDEGCGHGAEHNEGLEDLPPLQLIYIIDVRQRHAQHQAGNRGAESHLKAVKQRGKVVGIAEKLPEVPQGKSAGVAVQHGLGGDAQNRIEHEQQIQRQDDQADRNPYIQMEAFLFLYHGGLLT